MDWDEREDGSAFFTFLVCLLNLAALLAAYFYPKSLPLLTIGGLALTFLSWFFFYRDRREYGSPARIPAAIQIFAAVACLHAFIGFFANTSITGWGKFREIDGVYYRWQQGQQLEITWEEYDRLQRANNRVFSGCALAFSSIAFAHFAGVWLEEKEKG